MTTTPLQISSLLPLTSPHPPPPPPNKNFDRTRSCFHPDLDIGLPLMLDHFHKSGVFINPVFHLDAGSSAYKIETFAFRKRTKTETATCLLVMIFTKGPGPQSFKSARAFSNRRHLASQPLLLFRLVNKKWGPSPATLIQIYKQCVRPIFEYGSVSTITTSDNIISKI